VSVKKEFVLKRLARVVWLLPALLAVAAIFAMSACAGDGGPVNSADFNSAAGWENHSGVNTDYNFEGEILNVRASAHRAVLGQDFNFRANTYFVVTMQYRFTSDGGSSTTRPRVGLAVGNVETEGTFPMVPLGPDWSTHRIHFFSGTHTEAEFRLTVNIATQSLGLVQFRHLQVTQISQSAAMGHNALSLSRDTGNLIKTQWVPEGSPSGWHSNELPAGWTASNPNMGTRIDRVSATGYSLTLSFDEFGSGHIVSRVPVVRGRYYRLTFTYRISDRINRTPAGDQIFPNRVFGLFASLQGHQNDILPHGMQPPQGQTNDRFNFYNRFDGERNNRNDPVFFFAQRDHLYITFNLGIPNGGESLGSVEIWNIQLEEVDITTPQTGAFIQGVPPEMPIGAIIAVTIALVLAAGVLAGGIIFVVKRKKKNTSKEST